MTVRKQKIKTNKDDKCLDKYRTERKLLKTNSLSVLTKTISTTESKLVKSRNLRHNVEPHLTTNTKLDHIQTLLFLLPLCVTHCR